MLRRLRHLSSLAFVGLVAGSSSWSCSATKAPPPFATVTLVVDTDLPTPRLASRLRADLFREDGTWFASHDVALPDVTDWPASFSIVSPDESKATRVLVRLRAYPSGRVRDYRGERHRPRPVHRPPHAPSSVAQMCAEETELHVGGTAVLRHDRAIFQEVDGARCSTVSRIYSGLAAAYVDVTDPGRYTFAALDTYPRKIPGEIPDTTQVVLQIRRDCADTLSAVDCRDATTDVDHWTLPVFDVDLTSGRYHVVVGTTFLEMAPRDVLVGVTHAGELGTLPTDLRPPTPDTEVLALELEAAAGPTPTTEPAPDTAVDRLVLVELTPGQERTVKVVLQGDCVGTMARLGVGKVDVTTATTCVDAARLRVPVTSVAGDDASVTARFGEGAPCPSDVDPERACIPGGAFILGHATVDDFGGHPVRTVSTSTFVLDRHEVTVGEWKHAVADGLVIKNPEDRPRVPRGGGMRCLSTLAGDAYDDYPVDCIDWYGARAYCLFRGGDLPTEVQFEYAASQSGRVDKTFFPWGDDVPECHCDVVGPTCHSAIFSRGKNGRNTGWAICFDPADATATSGPLPVTASLEAGDVNPEGVYGLSGNAIEWVLDAYANHDETCWAAALPRDAACLEDDAPVRLVRGGSWWNTDTSTISYVRHSVRPAQLSDEAGFRCAYAVPR